jgi:uncharacterized repeat protein (TIGR03803 family)
MTRTLLRILPVAFFAFTLCNLASAQNWKEVIDESVGLYAGGPVTADSSGNLYGVNSAGGGGQCYPYGCGQVYEFQPNAHKPTQFLYSFSGTTDGSSPYGRVIFDSKGNLYGTARYGGDLTACGGSGCGVVYELSPGSSGWTETVLYNFEGGNDGISPVSIVFDGKGNLFGVTVDGGGNTCPGNSQCGTVFELSPNSSGGWTETVLHSFAGLADGSVPLGALVLDKQGNLYGAAGQGGNTVCTLLHGCGVIFELSPGSSGWTFSTIYSFDNTHGAFPMGSLVMDASGNLYGNADEGARATSSHCPYGCGSTFELSPSSSGWKLSLLHSYSNGLDGGNPYGGLLLDGSGNLYGATYTGGSQAYGCSNGYEQGCGVVFKISPASGGKWIFDRLYTFQGYDGFLPYGDLIMDSSGNLYGTTIMGDGGYGNVFELVPPSH